jgi:hypothetical protein
MLNVQFSMLNSEQEVEVCDATKVYSSIIAGNTIINLVKKRTSNTKMNDPF